MRPLCDARRDESNLEVNGLWAFLLESCSYQLAGVRGSKNFLVLHSVIAGHAHDAQDHRDDQQ